MKLTNVLLFTAIVFVSCNESTTDNSSKTGKERAEYPPVNSLLPEGYKGPIKEIITKTYPYQLDGIGTEELSATYIDQLDRRGRSIRYTTLNSEGEIDRTFELIDSNDNTVKRFITVNNRPLGIEQITYSGQECYITFYTLKDGDTTIAFEYAKTYYPSENYLCRIISTTHPQNTLDTSLVRTINTSDTSKIIVKAEKNNVDTTTIIDLAYDSYGNPTKQTIKYPSIDKGIYQVNTYTYYDEKEN